MIERRFGELTNKRIRRKSRESVKQRIEAIRSFIESWNRSGRAFTWTKPADVAGLYMNPPDNAIVLCVDGKSQIQAAKPGSRTRAVCRD
jgi:phage-related protein